MNRIRTARDAMATDLNIKSDEVRNLKNLCQSRILRKLALEEKRVTDCRLPVWGTGGYQHDFKWR